MPYHDYIFQMTTQAPKKTLYHDYIFQMTTQADITSWLHIPVDFCNQCYLGGQVHDSWLHATRHRHLLRQYIFYSPLLLFFFFFSLTLFFLFNFVFTCFLFKTFLKSSNWLPMKNISPMWHFKCYLDLVLALFVYMLLMSLVHRLHLLRLTFWNKWVIWSTTLLGPFRLQLTILLQFPACLHANTNSIYGY